MSIEIPWDWLLRPWNVCTEKGLVVVQPRNSTERALGAKQTLDIAPNLQNDTYRWYNAATLLMSVGPEQRELVRALLGSVWDYGNLGLSRSWPPKDEEIKDMYAPTCWPRDWGFETMSWPRDVSFEATKPTRTGELLRVSEVDFEPKTPAASSLEDLEADFEANASEADFRELLKLAQDLAKEESVPASTITIQVCGVRSHVHDSKGPQVSSEDGSWVSTSCSQCGSLAIDRIGEMP